MKRYKTVDEYIAGHPEYKDGLIKLRQIMLKTEMQETVKWGAPVYTVNGKNVAGLGAFKSYLGIWFFQGVFLQDTAKKLINAQEGRTVAMRQWRFRKVAEMDENLILSYLEEAIQNQKDGKEIKPKRDKTLNIPELLHNRIEQDPDLKMKFGNLTKTKKREFADYILEAKRDVTKQKRLEKIIPMIRNGIGLNDIYR